VRRPAVATPGQGPTPVGRRAAAHGGVVYRLQNGELTAIGPDGLERFLATGIFRVFPTSRGLFAVGSGPTGAPELWVREMTGGRPWRLVSRFRYRTRVLDVVALPGRGGDWLCARGSREPGLLLITSEGLRTADLVPLRRRLLTDTVRPDRLIWRICGEHTLEVGQFGGEERSGEIGERPGYGWCRLGTLSLTSGHLVWGRTLRGVGQVAQGEAGVYGLSHGGVLRRFDGDRFRRFGRGVRCGLIVGVGRRVLWVRLEDGGLASVNARTARLRRVPKVRVSFATPFDMDSVTDDLVVVAGERFLRVRARDGSVEIVR
jgi:hypothetical protein